MVYIGLDEASLFIWRGVSSNVARIGRCGVVVIVCPFGKVICKLETPDVSCCILKVNDN